MEEPERFKLSDLTRSFRAVPEMIVLACVTFLGMGMLTPIVKLYAVEHLGLSETQFGLLIAPIAAAMGISAVPLGRLGDRYGKCLAVCWGLFASAAAMWVLALFRSIFLAAAAGIVIGLGFTVAFPAWNALVLSVTSPDRRGEVLGAVGMAQGLAAIVGASLGAFIYSSDLFSFPRLGVVNYNVPFWLSAILLTVGTVITFTWVRNAHCHRDPGLGVTGRQQRVVVTAAVLGLVCLAAWISYRYTRPVAPDRVAWGWVQQLVRGKPGKGLKFVLRRGPGGWDGAAASRKAARTYNDWKTRREARYTVYFADFTAEDRADVRVVFTLAGKEVRTEHVILCKLRSGDWKVCGLYSEQ
jgi:MFS family permease